MNNKKIKEYQEELEKIEKELKKGIKEDETSPDFGDDSDHDGESSEKVEAIVDNLGIAKGERDRLEDVENALTKIKEGKYGSCEKCKKPIEERVLDIDPESRLCKACKK
ncbi:MAG: hypothetical protein EXS49_02130 [Candidatus Pacebacteria bacterium]|nr:hypothetical protein [Candidatus Paceibacterota bacterium]